MLTHIITHIITHWRAHYNRITKPITGRLYSNQRINSLKVLCYIHSVCRKALIYVKCRKTIWLQNCNFSVTIAITKIINAEKNQVLTWYFFEVTLITYRTCSESV